MIDLPSLPFDLGEQIDMLRDTKLYQIGAGASEISRMLIGRELFGETK